MSIWDGGWADQPEAEREGDCCLGNPEPWGSENVPPEEEFDDKAGDGAPGAAQSWPIPSTRCSRSGRTRKRSQKWRRAMSVLMSSLRTATPST